MRYWPLVLFLLVHLAYREGDAQQANAATKSLHDLFAAEWDYDMRQSPERASELGDRRWNDRWSDDSLESFARRNQHNQDLLAQMAKIDRAFLSPADQLNYDLFRKGFQESVEGYKFHGFLLRLNQRGGIQTTD